MQHIPNLNLHRPRAVKAFQVPAGSEVCSVVVPLFHREQCVNGGSRVVAVDGWPLGTVVSCGKQVPEKKIRNEKCAMKVD